MSEEEREMMQTLVKEVNTLKNIVEGQRLDIEKFSKMARQIDMIKLSEVTKGNRYESNV